jgi:protein-S-isoprenylcysteine O-methyltransferase Ste14
MAILGLALMIGWVLVIAAVPTYRQLRRTGSISPRVADPRGSPQWWSRRFATIGFGLGLLAPLAGIAGFPAIEALDQPAVAVAGILLVVAGIGLSLIAQSVMGASWRPDVDPDARTELVTDGPFRWVRNPALTGTAVTSIGAGPVHARLADPGPPRRGAIPAERPRRRLPTVRGAGRTVRAGSRALAGARGPAIGGVG